MMYKRTARPVSLILALMLLAGIFCAVPVFAEEQVETPMYEPTPDWGADGVFEIANASDLLAFSEYDSDFAGETVKLTANIDLNPGWTAAPGSQADGNLPVNYWIPVQNFKGTFDGQNFSISGIFIYNDSIWDNGGLFAKVDGATIKNLVIKNSYMFTNHASGGVAACVENNTCTFENIYVDTIIEPKNPMSPCCYVGGIVGRQTTAGANYINCVFAGSVTGREGVGGIVGVTASDYGVTDPAQATVTTFQNCVNLGNVAAVQYENNDVNKRISGISGGIAGRASGNVSFEGCINLGTADTANGSTNRWVSGGALTVLDASNSDNNTADFSHTVTFKAPPHNSGKRNRATIKCQKAHKAPELVPAWRTDSDRQATPVGQNQIRQREQHIQLRGLLSQSSVARFSVPELPFDDREHVLNLCPN